MLQGSLDESPAPYLPPSQQLREFFIILPGEDGPPSAQKGTCKACNSNFTLRSDRMAKHFAGGKGGSVARCQAPPDTAVALSQLVQDAARNKAAKAAEARKARSMQQHLLDMPQIGTGSVTNQAFAPQIPAEDEIMTSVHQSCDSEQSTQHSAQSTTHSVQSNAQHGTAGQQGSGTAVLHQHAAAHTAGAQSAGTVHPETPVRQRLLGKRPSPSMQPRQLQQLREYFDILPGEGGPPSTQKGTCKACNANFTLRADRMAAHFSGGKGGSVAKCQAPPDLAVELSQLVQEASKDKALKAAENSARKGSSKQQIFLEARSATNQAFAPQVLAGDGMTTSIPRTSGSEVRPLPPSQSSLHVSMESHVPGQRSTARIAESSAQHTSATIAQHQNAAPAAHTTSVQRAGTIDAETIRLQELLGKRPSPSMRSIEQLREFFSVLPSEDGPPSTNKGRCIACGTTFTLRTDRMAAHFLGGKGGSVSRCRAPPDLAVELSQLVVEDAVKKTKASKSAGTSAAREGKSSKQQHLLLPDTREVETRAATNEAFAQWVFGTGQSFGVGENHFFNSFLRALLADPSWSPEDRVTMATTRLDAMYGDVEKDVQSAIGSDREKFGCTLSIDGWAQGQADCMVNVQRVTMGKQEHVKIVNCRGPKKDMQYLAGMIDPNVDKTVGFVVADGACADLVKIMEHRYPWITGLKCAARSIDLLIKDIANFPWARATVAAATKAVKFLQHHQIPLAVFKEKNGGKGLVLPKATRFGSTVILALRFNGAKQALMDTVADERYTNYLSDKSVKKSTRTTAEEVKHFVLDDGEREGSTWYEINFFLKVLEPIFALVLPEGAMKPQAAQLFYRLTTVLDKLENALRADLGLFGIKDRLLPIQEALQACRKYMHSPVYGAAFALDPEYYWKDVHDVDDGQSLADLKTMAERILIDHGEDAAEAIRASWELEEGGAVGRCMIQFAKFKTGDFRGKIHLGSAKSLSGAVWWNTLAKAGMPELAAVAVRVLSMVPVAAGWQRDCGVFGEVADGEHARMNSTTRAKLVYVRANLQLMHREHVKGDGANSEEGAEEEMLSGSDEDGDDDNSSPDSANDE